jgi:hypothetical protein
MVFARAPLPDVSGWLLAEEIERRVSEDALSWPSDQSDIAHRIACLVELEREIVCEGLATAVINVGPDDMSQAADCLSDIGCNAMADVAREAISNIKNVHDQALFDSLENRWENALADSDHDDALREYIFRNFSGMGGRTL